MNGLPERQTQEQDSSRPQDSCDLIEALAELVHVLEHARAVDAIVRRTGHLGHRANIDHQVAAFHRDHLGCRAGGGPGEVIPVLPPLAVIVVEAANRQNSAPDVLALSTEPPISNPIELETGQVVVCRPGPGRIVSPLEA